MMRSIHMPFYQTMRSLCGYAGDLADLTVPLDGAAMHLRAELATARGEYQMNKAEVDRHDPIHSLTSGIVLVQHSHAHMQPRGWPDAVAQLLRAGWDRLLNVR